MNSVLSIDCSTTRGSVALWQGGEMSFAEEFAFSQRHDVHLFATLERALARAGGKVEGVVVGTGPGSYTGIRVAIAAAQGLEIAFSCRLLGLPSIWALPTEESRYAVVGDARRQSYFLARVGVGSWIAEPRIFARPKLEEALAELEMPVFACDEAEYDFAVERVVPSAARLAALAVEKFARGEAAQVIEPIYLRAPYITQSKRD